MEGLGGFEDAVRTKISNDIIPAIAFLRIVAGIQSVDGAGGPTQEVLRDYGQIINLLCEGGYVRKIDVTEGALPYRMTWKGLRCIDTFDWYQTMLKVSPLDRNRCDLAWAALVAFH